MEIFTAIGYLMTIVVIFLILNQHLRQTFDFFKIEFWEIKIRYFRHLKIKYPALIPFKKGVFFYDYKIGFCLKMTNLVCCKSIK